MRIAAPSMPEDDRDLGFGSKVATESRLRFLNRDGILMFAAPDSAKFRRFGLVYSSLGAGSLVDTSSEPTVNMFLRGFFFSVQTFATIGYGTIHPVGVVPNLLVTIESYYSLLANALITGLVFARFSRIIAASKALCFALSTAATTSLSN